MPDEHGRFRGITVPPLPWLDRTPEVTPEEDEAFEQLEDRTNRDPVPYTNTE